jgi:hypothetical protein
MKTRLPRLNRKRNDTDPLAFDPHDPRFYPRFERQRQPQFELDPLVWLALVWVICGAVLGVCGWVVVKQAIRFWHGNFISGF